MCLRTSTQSSSQTKFKSPNIFAAKPIQTSHFSNSTLLSLSPSVVARLFITFFFLFFILSSSGVFVRSPLREFIPNAEGVGRRAHIHAYFQPSYKGCAVRSNNHIHISFREKYTGVANPFPAEDTPVIATDYNIKLADILKYQFHPH